MKYVFQYSTLVNRDYNIYKEIIINPFIFSFLGVYDPLTVKSAIEYSKTKDVNILKNIIPGNNLNTAVFITIYKMLLDYEYFATEQFNVYSKYVDDLLASSKVEEVTILVNDVATDIENQEIENIKNRFNSHIKLKIVRTDSIFVSKDLEEIEWNCVCLRDVEEAIELINSNISIKNKDIILDELPFNKIDPVNYILLQEKEGRVDYRAMI